MIQGNAQSQEPGAEQRGLKQALEQLTERVSELCTYTRYLGRVQLDALEVRVRRTALKLVFGLFGALGFTALTFVLLLDCIQALARGFATWAAWPEWGGTLLVETVFLAAAVGAAFAGYCRWQRRRVEHKREVYDERIREQQARYDRNVHTAVGTAV